MTVLLQAVCIAELLIVLLLLIRLARGPSVLDRVLALNTICSQCAMAVLFFAAFADRSSYADVALWMASFSYLAALVWARYLERGLL
jgi:multicomponent Na+:H+ antiporter subunit F